MCSIEVLGEGYGESEELKWNLMQWAGKHEGGWSRTISVDGLDEATGAKKGDENNLPSGLNSWWEQCKGQARADQIPVLFHRMNGRDWNVRTLEYRRWWMSR